jgi:hypothetical protein
LPAFRTSHQTDIVEIEPFGHHLRADQNIDGVILKVVNYLFKAFFCFYGIKVEACRFGIREKFPNFFFNLFGAESFGL